jgi:hypothetical protein
MLNARFRFWVECGLAVLSTVLAVSSMIWPNWIELVFDADPDGGDGSFEWGIVLAFVLAALVFAIIARFEFGRLAARANQN